MPTVTKTKPIATSVASPSRFRIPTLPGGHSAKPSNSTYPIPVPLGDSTMTLADLVGTQAAKAIEATGQIKFHSLGDTGRGPDTAEQAVAEAMARDIDPNHHETSPAFLLHLGDVIYGDGKRDLYDDEFYRPFGAYPNKFIAVPGNHDAEEGVAVDKVSLEAFQENFCAPPGTQPPVAQRFGCEMVNQPGVYWILETKLLHLIGLYSNAAENFGVLADSTKHKVNNIGTAQVDWLAKMLKKIKSQRAQGQRKALIFAMHHPPYAQGLQTKGSGHPGSPEMLQQMDDVCQAVGLMPDAVLSGHTHTYARYMRTNPLNGKKPQIPYLVVGAGGHAAQPAPSGVGFSSNGVTYANGAPQKGVVPAHGAQVGYGFLTVTVTPGQIVLGYTLVQDTHRQPFESITVPLA